MYTVTRQRQWPDGINMVEVSRGGIDYTNPDALCAKYPGEFQEYSNPVEAIETAIEIVRAWRKDIPGQRISLGIGATLGMTLPFEPITFAQAKQWAKRTWEKLPKCARCNDVLPDETRERYQANDWDGLEYCSEQCATRAIEFEQQEYHNSHDWTGEDSEYCAKCGLDENAACQGFCSVE